MDIQSFFENYTALEQLWKKFLAEKSKYRNTSALGITAMRICYYIIKNPDCALKEIALSLNISLGSASQMVQAMVQSNLLICQPNKNDRRRISIRTTPVLEDYFKALQPE